MYLTPDKLQWGSIYSKFPIVKYKVNPSMIGFNTGDKNQILDLIQNAANLWSFQSGESHFQLSYNRMSTSEPVGYDAQTSKTQIVQDKLAPTSGVVRVTAKICLLKYCILIWRLTLGITNGIREPIIRRVTTYLPL